jgi:hypothetical protein
MRIEKEVELNIFRIASPPMQNQCCGFGMLILDPNFSIPDQGSKRSRIPDPDPHQII